MIQFQAATLLFYCCSARIFIFSHLAGMSRTFLPTDKVVCLECSGAWKEGGNLNKQVRQRATKMISGLEVGLWMSPPWKC